jgi:5'-nucleotidase|tara:strand:+ start:131 stop:667 length:537 start_codon:yes stop_codon:yes gene_type:complete
MIILVDMDDVIVEFEKKIIELIIKSNPEKKELFKREKEKFKLSEEYPELKKIINDIKEKKGFMKSLEPVEGSIEALKEIKGKGHKVIICTSPLSKYEHSVKEKYDWIGKNLGYEWTKKIILTKDKTLIKGDILIDDKPNISGLKNPEWEHVLFDKSYNKHVKNKRRLTWKNWKEILNI